MQCRRLLEIIPVPSNRPANDNPAKVLTFRPKPVTLSNGSWFYLQRDTIRRDASNGLGIVHDFIVVPAPVNPRDDSRYLYPFRRDGWCSKFVDPADDSLPMAVDTWDPADPIGSLRTLLVRCTDWDAKLRECHLTNCRHITV